MKTWEIAQVEEKDTEGLKRYLQENWEPFAVTASSHSGYATIWLKKQYGSEAK